MSTAHQKNVVTCRLNDTKHQTKKDVIRNTHCEIECQTCAKTHQPKQQQKNKKKHNLRLRDHPSQFDSIKYIFVEIIICEVFKIKQGNIAKYKLKRDTGRVLKKQRNNIVRLDKFEAVKHAGQLLNRKIILPCSILGTFYYSHEDLLPRQAKTDRAQTALSQVTNPCQLNLLENTTESDSSFAMNVV